MSKMLYSERPAASGALMVAAELSRTTTPPANDDAVHRRLKRVANLAKALLDMLDQEAAPPAPAAAPVAVDDTPINL